MLARLVMWSTYRTLHCPVTTVEALTRDLLPVLAGGIVQEVTEPPVARP